MKKKVMFVIPSLIGGGAEKVLVDIVNNLSPDKYDLYLVLFEKKGIFLKNIPAYVELLDLKKIDKLKSFDLILKLARILKKLKPDNIIGFMNYANIVSILAMKISHSEAKLIITIHTHLSRLMKEVSFGCIKIYLYKMLIKDANQIVVPSKGILDMLVKDFNLKQSNINVIPHPLLIDKIKEKSNEQLNSNIEKPFILAVGRLTKQKGYPFLFKAYQRICDQIDENLIVIGIGEEEPKLKLLVKELGIESRVVFAGFQENPYKFMKNSSIFVLSSLWESFAIVIVEAMACGVPVIATDCPSGPGELIINGENGILVPIKDVETLSNEILQLLRNKELRIKFSEQGKIKAYSLRVENIVPLYEKYFV